MEEAAVIPLHQDEPPKSQQFMLEEVRQSNPQWAIDYLFRRKEQYKGTVRRLNQLLSESQTKVAKAQEEADSWKRKARKERAMNNWLKLTCLGLGFLLVSVLATVFVVGQLTAVRTPINYEPQPPRVPTSGTLQDTPNCALASILIYNGRLQGSGTVISKGDQYAAILTAAHNFKGKVGGDFWVYYPDGTYTKAILLAHDTKRDLALARVAVDTIVGHVYVPKEMTEDRFSAVGYTNGQGPNFKDVTYRGHCINNHKKRMWSLQVTSGDLWNGDSGGGVFLGNALVGVTSERDAYTYQQGQTYKNMYACAFEEIIQFLQENKLLLAGCGDWTQPPEAAAVADAPPLWRPNPNIPLYVSTNPEVAAIKQRVQEVEQKLEALNKGGLRKPSEIPASEPKEANPLLRKPSEVRER